MLVMLSNNTGFEAGRIYGENPGRIGHLHSPDCIREPIYKVPWALDNGVFGAWNSKREWSEEPFYNFLERYSFLNPSWVVVPDWVGDKERTLDLWEKHSPALRAMGLPLAFVCQDGMEESLGDVPECDVIFVGGSTSFKWRTLTTWTENFPRVHVGRVNTEKLLWQAHIAGAESTDGTGFFRGCRKQLAGLERYLKESTPNKPHPQPTLNL